MKRDHSAISNPIPKPYFVVSSPLGKAIRTTKSYWNTIVNVKHPILKGREKDVKRVIQDPEEIRQSVSDPDVFLYYRKWKRYHHCVVVRQLNGDGYIITTYITSKKKEGSIIWRKK